MTSTRLACGVLAMCSMVAPVTAAPNTDDPRSEGVASALAIGGTLAGVAAAGAALELPEHATPLALVAGGFLVFGPSFGRWYAGEVWSTGLAMRLTVGAVALAGAPLVTQMNHNAEPGGEYLVFLGLVAAVGAVATAGVALDLGGTAEAVRAYNRAHQAGRMTVGPTALRSGGALQPGIAVSGVF